MLRASGANALRLSMFNWYFPSRSIKSVYVKKSSQQRTGSLNDPSSRVFSDARRIPTWGRGLALAAFDLLPPARRLLAERMIHGAPT